MKIYFDDVRIPDSDWTQIKTPEEVIEWLETGLVDEISLDGSEYKKSLEVLNWLERQVMTCKLEAPLICIHAGDVFFVYDIKKMKSKIYGMRDFVIKLRKLRDLLKLNPDLFTNAEKEYIGEACHRLFDSNIALNSKIKKLLSNIYWVK